MLQLRLPGRFFAVDSTPHAVKKRQRTVVAGFAAAARSAVRSCDREDGWRQGGSKDGDSWSSDAEPLSCELRAGPFEGRRVLAGKRSASQRKISEGLRRYFGLVGILHRLNDQNPLLGSLTQAGAGK